MRLYKMCDVMGVIPYSEGVAYHDIEFDTGMGSTLVTAANGTGKTSMVVTPNMLLFDKSWHPKSRDTMLKLAKDGYLKTPTVFIAHYLLDHKDAKNLDESQRFLMIGWAISDRTGGGEGNETLRGRWFRMAHGRELFELPPRERYEKIGLRFLDDTPEGLMPRTFEQIDDCIKKVGRTHCNDFKSWSAAEERSYLADIEDRLGISIEGYRFLAGKMASQEEAEKLLKDADTDHRMLNDFIFPLISFTAYPDEKKADVNDQVAKFVGDRMQQGDDHEFIERAEKFLPELNGLRAEAEELDALGEKLDEGKRTAAALYKGVCSRRDSVERELAGLDAEGEELRAQRKDIDRRELASEIYLKVDLHKESERAFTVAEAAANDAARRLKDTEAARLKEAYAIDRDEASIAEGDYKGACDALDGRLEGDLARRVTAAAVVAFASGKTELGPLDDALRAQTDKRSDLLSRKAAAEKGIASLRADVSATESRYREASRESDRMQGQIDSKLATLGLSRAKNVDRAGYASEIVRSEVDLQRQATDAAAEALQTATQRLQDAEGSVESLEGRLADAVAEAAAREGAVHTVEARKTFVDKVRADVSEALDGAVPMTAADAGASEGLYGEEADESRRRIDELKAERSKTDGMLADVLNGTLHASSRQAKWFKSNDIDVAWGESELLKMDPEKRREVLDRSHGAAAFSAIVSDADLEFIKSAGDFTGRGPGSPVIVVESGRVSDLGAIDLGSDVLTVPNYDYLYDPDSYREALEADRTRMAGEIADCEKAAARADAKRIACMRLLNAFTDHGEPAQLQRELDAARVECDKANELVSRLRGELSEAKRTVETLRALVETAKEDKREAEVRLAALCEVSEGLIPRFDVIHGNELSLAEELDALGEKLDEGKAALTEIERDLHEVGLSIDHLNERVGEIDAELRGLPVDEDEIDFHDVEVVPFSEALSAYRTARAAADKDAEELTRRRDELADVFKRAEGVRRSSEVELLNVLGASSLDEVEGIPCKGSKRSLDEAAQREREAIEMNAKAGSALDTARKELELARRAVVSAKDDFKNRYPDTPLPGREGLGSGFVEEREQVDTRIAKVEVLMKASRAISDRVMRILNRLSGSTHLFEEYLDSANAIQIDDVSEMDERVTSLLEEISPLSNQLYNKSGAFSRRCRRDYEVVDRTMPRIKEVFRDFEAIDYASHAVEGVAPYVGKVIGQVEGSIVAHKAKVHLVDGDADRLAGMLHDITIDLIDNARGLKSSTGKSVRIKELEGISLYGSGDDTEALEHHNTVTGYFKRHLVDLAKRAFDPATDHVDKKVVEKELQPAVLIKVWMAAMGMDGESLTVQFRSAREGQGDKWLGIKAAAKQSGGESGSSYLVLLAGLVSLLRKGDKDVTIPLILDNSFHGVSNSEFYDRIFSLFEKNGIQLIMVADQPDIRLRDKFDTQIVLKKGSDAAGNKLIRVAKENQNEEIRIAVLQKLGIAHQEAFGF